MSNDTTANTAFTDLQDNNTILRPKAAAKKCGLGVSTIWAKAKDDNDPFPKPIQLTQMTSGWIEREINKWIRDRILESRGPNPINEKPTPNPAKRRTRSVGNGSSKKGKAQSA